MKYTAIVIGQSGAIHVWRIEKRDDETVADMIWRYGFKNNIQYLFEGWPFLVGENEDDLKVGKI